MRLRTEPLLIALFLGLWIGPAAYWGLFNGAAPWLPPSITRWSDVSRLFSHETPLWAVYEARAHFRGDLQPTIISESLISEFRPFGYRTRFQRLMDLAGISDRDAFARCLRELLEQNEGRHREVDRVEFVTFPYRIGGRTIGHYVQPCSTEIPSDKIEVISIHEFSRKQAE